MGYPQARRRAAGRSWITHEGRIVSRFLMRLLVAAASLLAAPAAFASANGVVISEFQFRGPTGGNDEFVELLNTSSVPVEISGWRLQGCAGASGAASNRATVPGGVTLASGQHYLFANSAGSYAPIADATYGTGISDDGGAQIVLAAGTKVDGVANQDSSADVCREGTGLAIPTTNGNRAFERKDEGRQDTDSNVDDFVGPQVGNPQPFGAPPEPPPATPYQISEIQGTAHRSPHAGERVLTTGIVTVARSSSFYLQDPTPDADPATSEGILVFGVTAPVGAAVTVRGTVTEFRPGGAATNLTTTELAAPGLTVAVNLTGNPLPATTVVGVDRLPPLDVIEDDASGDVETGGVLFDPSEDGLDFWESLEGMLVGVSDAEVVGPTNDFGEIPVSVGGLAELRTPRGGVILRPDDANPERIILDDALVPVPPANVGDTFAADPAGVLDYSFANFKLLVTQTPAVVPGGLTQETTESPRRKELAVATFNVENLDPSDGAAKYSRLASLIVNNLQAPDLIALEEVQDNDGPTNTPITDPSVTLATLVAAIQAAGGPLYQWRQIDPVDDQDGGEPGGNIRVAFLFRTDRGLRFVDRPGGTSITSTEVRGRGGSTRLSVSPGRIQPLDPAFANSRKPLAGEFRYRSETLFIVANHFNSKGGDQPLFGRFQPPARVTEAQRHAQATIVDGFVDQILARDRRANVIVLGDLNDFEFSETLAIVKGGVLTNLIETLPVPERYTYVFEGNSQSLDHILVSHEIARVHVLEYDIVHVNSEFADQVSDHDPQVARFAWSGDDDDDEDGDDDEDDDEDDD